MTDFEKLFIESKDYIYKFLVKLSGNSSLAEELTQETFFRAYINYSSLRNKDKVSVWLCQIAKNSYFLWYNEHKKLDNIDDSTELYDLNNLEDYIVRQDVSREAMGIINKLDEPYKEVFVLSVFGGLSFKQISESFGKSESWARVTFYRARQKISESMR